jgi:hypothetical protein
MRHAGAHCYHPRTYGAIMVRADMRCAYCLCRLTKRNKSVDHLNGDHHDNRPSNWAAACRPCNRLKDTDAFALHLDTRGTTVADAMARAERQARQPLDRHGPLTTHLVERWYPGRLAAIRRYQRRPRQRRNRT